MLGSMDPEASGFPRQLGVAIGKLARVGSTWLLVQDLGLVNAETWGEIEAKRDHARRLTRGLFAALGPRAAGRVIG